LSKTHYARTIRRGQSRDLSVVVEPAMRGLRNALLAACLSAAVLGGMPRAEEPIRIASSLPLTGNSAWYGAQGRNGAALAEA
jgi:ABC-type branched-subunit amino acid transport system substrate-binding protein